MSLLDRVREQTREALAGQTTEEIDELTEEQLEEILGAEGAEPNWEQATEAPEGVDPEAWCLYYCWSPVRIGTVWHFYWYMGTPPRGSCVTTTGRRRLDYIRNTGFRCSNGRYIYQIGWPC